MRPLPLAIALTVVLLVPALAQGQATAAPDFAAGAVKVYAHASADSTSVWMNTLVDDGGGTPYYFYGSPAVASQAGQTPALEPVANQPFEARIALTPVLTQTLVLDGTVNVQAYIGGGTYTAGTASIGTSLVAGGAELGNAPAKSHSMSPKQAGQTYDPISWSFSVKATVPAGTALEWVIKGTASGNNVYLAAHEARGRSYIELPVASASGGLGAGAPVLHDLPGFPAKANLTAAAPTNATHLYNLTIPAGPVLVTLAGNRTAGQAEVAILAGNKTLGNATFTGAPRSLNLTGPGNWTLSVQLKGFHGNLTVTLQPPPPKPTASGTTSGKPTTATKTGSAGATGTTGAGGNGTADDDGKDTPGPGLPLLAIGLAGALALVRRRRG